MTLEELYYFHAFLNYKLFKGELEPVAIRFFDDNNSQDGTIATILTETDPFIICMDKSLLEGDPVFTITILLHEMIHQYNRQREEEDIDEYTGEHNEIFKQAAEKKGMITGGYGLTAETKNLIEEQLKLFSWATALHI